MSHHERRLINDSGAHGVLSSGMFERHFSPRTLSELWGFSEDTIVRWFEDVAGVLKSGCDGARGKRRKITLRIPESIAMRIYQERTK